MRPERLGLSRPLRRWLYGAGAAVFVTGISWLAMDLWGQNQTEFGPQPSAVAPWLLRAHGAAAMAMLLVFGALIPLHLRRGWHAKVNRRSGVVIAASCGLLVVTGYALYYAGGEQLRRVAVVTHDVLGCAIPVVLLWHIRRGLAHRRAKLMVCTPMAAPRRSESPAPESGS